MKNLLSAMIFAAALNAGTLTCPPNFATDSIAVSPSCSGLGAQVIAAPSSDWLLSWNDNNNLINPSQNDFDFNDQEVSVDINALGTLATVTFVTALSDSNNELYDGTEFLLSNTNHSLPVVISVSPGEAIPFSLTVPSASIANVWYTGPASANIDNQVHDWTIELSRTSVVPEPSAWMFLGGALLFVLRRQLIAKVPA